MGVSDPIAVYQSIDSSPPSTNVNTNEPIRLLGAFAMIRSVFHFAVISFFLSSSLSSAAAVVEEELSAEERHFPAIPRLVTSRFFLTAEKPTYKELSLLSQDSIGEGLNEDDAFFKDLLDDDEDEEESFDLFSGKFHEGDIAGVTLATVTSLDEFDKEEETKNAIIHTFQRWPNGEIPYVISSSYSGKQRSVIYGAMTEFERKSCVKWRPRSLQDRDYVHILPDEGCYSRVGRMGYGGQVLSLGQGCVSHGTVVHELLHAAGFWHEQSRPDRDNFVAVRWENIEPGKEDNFARYSRGEVSTLDLDYDLQSIMHYDSRAFSRNGHPTIVALSGSQQMGQRDGMTLLDVKKLNKLYECESKSIQVDQCRDVLDEAFCTELRDSDWCVDYESYMNEVCMKTCDKCGDGGAPFAANCQDKHERCEAWANFANQCVTNRAFMETTCAKSCGLCHYDSRSGGDRGKESFFTLLIMPLSLAKALLDY